MNKKISVIIPTLQKNKELLINLLRTLSNDSEVDEIIVIDNSLKGIEENIEKLKLIIPKENLFVNPSWNLGVKEAKNDIIALLNDDITIPDNFCSNITSKLKPEMGVVGYFEDFVEITHDIVQKPQQTEITLKEITARPEQWGIAIFFYKSSYYEIPQDLKILFGDEWLIHKNNEAKKQNYMVLGQKIYHYSSMSVRSFSTELFKKERKIYKKHTFKWYQHIFDIEKRFYGYRIRLFGINSKVIPYKKEVKCLK